MTQDPRPAPEDPSLPDRPRTRQRAAEPAIASPLMPGSETVTAVLAMLPELRFLINIAIAAVVIAALYFGRDILIPLALALLLGFVLDPFVARLKRLGLPRTPAVLAVIALAVALIGTGALLMASQVSAISAQLPTYQSNIQHKLEQARADASKPGMFDGVVKTFDTIKAELDRSMPTPSSVAGAKADVPQAQRVRVEEKEVPAYQKAFGLLEAGSGPLATAGIVLVFVVLVLLDRVDLRDRLLRLWSGNLHRSTDAMDEAGTRISRYLTMQLVVNLSYGVPMAAGLWFVGVPGAVLWGMTAGVMRFVPYLGPMISAVFPIVLAFAVDPGWGMVLWTIGLIVALELLSHNLVEPWLYGASTGLSAMSLMVAATFWTALWGPVGLIMSTPLTVCLLVIGRHLPRLKFFDVLLGSQPALDTPTRIYQRLLARDMEEAIELASEQCEGGNVTGFYGDAGIPVLRMASTDHSSVATAEHRHRVVIGMDGLLDDIREQHPAIAIGPKVEAICIGGKWEVDTLAAKMLAHSLSLAGRPAEFRAAAPVTAEYLAGLDLKGARAVCISYFSSAPQTQARHFCKRLRRRWPDLKIVLTLWNAPAELLSEAAVRALGADAVVTSLSEAVMRVSHLMGVDLDEGYMPAPVPEADHERLVALQASGALDPRAQPIFDAASRRAADIFDVPMAMVSLIGEDRQTVQGAFGQLSAPIENNASAARMEELAIPRSLSMCGHVVANAQTLVVPDIARDLRFAGNPALNSKGLRFYAGAPLRHHTGHLIGTLCILDTEPRTLTQRDVKLLESLADDVAKALHNAVLQWGDALPVSTPSVQAPSAIVGQAVPAAI